MKFDNIYKYYLEITTEFFSSKQQSEIKAKSQYFTPLDEVDKMLEDVKIEKKDLIKILDPACGNGILVLKILEKIFLKYNPKEILIDVYDLDNEVLKNFKKIIEKIQIKGTKLTITYFNEDFLVSTNCKKYDYIITNPPYKKINMEKAPINLKKYLNGQPNLYYLFIANSLEKLEKNGNFIIISPKNYLSGLYTVNLRKYILSNFSIEKIHIFDERRTIFKDVIQEICIVNITNRKNDNIKISYNGSDSFMCKKNEIVLDNDSQIIITPRNELDLELFNKFKQFTFGTIGKEIFFKPGKVVQFRVFEREKNLIPSEYFERLNGVPLLLYRHINKGYFSYERVTNGKKEKPITILDQGKQNSIFIKNSNYLLVKKNVDKGCDYLLKMVPYLKELTAPKLGIDNGLGYFTNKDDSLTKIEVLGIYCILMSQQFENYYFMMNSNHAINVYELKNMYFPSLEIIRKIGKKIENKKLTLALSTRIMEEYL